MVIDLVIDVLHDSLRMICGDGSGRVVDGETSADVDVSAVDAVVDVVVVPFVL
jgi:hypothetical protein